MSKAKKPGASVKTASPAPVKDVSDTHFSNLIVNGLSDVIFGFGPGTPGAQLSQVDTVFYNLRWYLLSNMRQPLSQSYAEIALIQTICAVPVEDAFRGGVNIKTKELDEDDIVLLHSKMEREKDLATARQANIWNRLYGGAGLLTMTDQKWSEDPFNVKLVKKDSPLKFRAVDMWELFYDKQNIEGDGTPLDNDTFRTYNYYGKKVDRTFVQKIVGIEAPSFIRPRLRGWGLSVVEAFVRSLNQYLKASDLGFEVLDEFKLDIFKIKGLTQALVSAAGTQKIRERVSLANSQKNFQNAITMDSEDDYVQKQLSWSGLGEAMAGIRTQIASDMRIPMIKLFGQASGGGLGSTGEDEIEVYNAMVESQVREKCKFEILTMVEIRCQQLFGFIPDDLTIEFKPLRVLSAEQEENVKTQKFTRLLQTRQAGEITAMEFREAINHDKLLPLQLDASQSIVDALEEEKALKNPAPDDKGEDNGSEDEDEASDDVEKVENSLGYDLASYRTDGGDQQFSVHHERDLENPDRMPDRGLIAQGEEASRELFGSVKWQFVYWFYQQHGGVLK